MQYICMGYKYIFVVLIFSISIAYDVRSQPLSKFLDQGDFEIGYTVRWNKRKMEPTQRPWVNWRVGTVSLRYGVTNWLNASFEGFASKKEQTNYLFYPSQYNDINVGAGLSSKVYTYKNFDILISTSYGELISFDKSHFHRDVQVASFMSGIEIQKKFPIEPLEFVVSLAPVYVYDKIIEQTESIDYTNTSLNNFGIAVGLDILLYHHGRIWCQTLYADFWQPRIGFSVIL